MTQLRLQHLLWRSGFGPAAGDWKTWESLPEKDWWPAVKAASAAPAEYFDVADNAVKGLMLGLGEAGKMERDDLDKEQKKRLRKQSREDIKSLNLRWLEEMTRSRAQLREKMALFWHGHFASRNLNILYQQQLLAIFRDHALGNFGEMLRAVSKSAAMLAFLNNQQNKKQHPNENFAREVMELFTLGRGHYTENDVKEAARAFTGWGFRLNGEFIFKKRDHDEGSKTVFGKTGAFDGDAVLDLLLEQRQTARFLARKLYRFLVNDDRVPEERVAVLGDRFYDSGYDILRLLDDIFQSEWFYDRENTGCKIKSPVELWVGLRRMLLLELQDGEAQLLVQKALGQVLFNPPNVAGWPGGKAWIDSSSLMFRLRLPQLVAWQDDFDLDTKDDDDQQMGEMQAIRSRRRRLAATADWKPILERFAGVPEDRIVPRITRALWNIPKPIRRWPCWKNTPMGAPGRIGSKARPSC